MSDVAPEFQGPRFDKYFASLQPIARRIARRRSERHPLLGSNDLMQQALTICLLVWQRYHPKNLPESDMTRIAVSAMDRRLRNVRRNALAFGEAEVEVVSLYKAVGERGGQLADLIPAPVDPRLSPEERRSLIDTRGVIRPRLGLDGRLALKRLVDPPDEGFWAYRETLDERAERGWTWRTAHSRGIIAALVASLGWDETRSQAAYREILRSRKSSPIRRAHVARVGERVIITQSRVAPVGSVGTVVYGFPPHSKHHGRVYRVRMEGTRRTFALSPKSFRRE